MNNLSYKKKMSAYVRYVCNVCVCNCVGEFNVLSMCHGRRHNAMSLLSMSFSLSHKYTYTLTLARLLAHATDHVVRLFFPNCISIARIL